MFKLKQKIGWMVFSDVNFEESYVPDEPIEFVVKMTYSEVDAGQSSLTQRAIITARRFSNRWYLQAAVRSFDVFISHSIKDKNFALRLANDLADAGFSIWIDYKQLSFNDSVAQALSDAVESSQFILILMSPDFFTSSWARAEMMAAMKEELDSGHIRVIPLMYKDCDPPPMLKDKLWVDFRDPLKYSDALERLVVGLKSLSSSERIAAPIEENPKIGQRAEELNSSAITELREILKEAVEAFKTKPATSIESERAGDSVIEEDLCFIVMPFGNQELNVVYEDFLKPTLTDICHLRCQRGDDVFGSDVIMDDIRRSIANARLIIADLTGRNANVFYEVGIAHTLNKLVLLLAQTIDDIPFDLRHRRVLLYDYSPRGCKKLERDLQANVLAILTG